MKRQRRPTPTAWLAEGLGENELLEVIGAALDTRSGDDRSGAQCQKALAQYAGVC